MLPTTLARLAIAAILTIALAGCSSTRLSDGLTQRMDSGTAQLNKGEAIGIINHYRSTVGAGPLIEDPALSAQAAKPEGTSEIRYSAGYATFADTFSGWRNSGQESLVMAGKSVTRAGIAVVYEENSPYGFYWVVIVA